MFIFVHVGILLMLSNYFYIVGLIEKEKEKNACGFFCGSEWYYCFQWLYV